MRRLFGILGTLGFVVGAMVIGSAIPARATVPSTSPPFNECPAIGSDTSCGLLIIIQPGGGLQVLQDNTQPPIDGVGGEDTLLGVYNNSGGAVSSINLVANSSPPAFGFEG